MPNTMRWSLAFFTIVTTRLALAQVKPELAVLPFEGNVPKLKATALQDELTGAAQQALEMPGPSLVELQNAVPKAKLKTLAACKKAECWQKGKDTLKADYALSTHAKLAKGQISLKMELINLGDGTTVDVANASLNPKVDSNAEVLKKALESLREVVKKLPGMAPEPEKPVAVTPAASVPAWLGVRHGNLDAAQSKRFGLPNVAGAWIVKITAGGPAEQAGLKVDDIVLAYNSNAVVSSEALTAALAKSAAGDAAVFKVWRENKEQHFTVTLGEKPAAN